MYVAIINTRYGTYIMYTTLIKFNKNAGGNVMLHIKNICVICINPLTAGAWYIRVFIFFSTFCTTFLNMLEIKCDINQQYLKTVDLHFGHFVKSE